MTQNKQIKTEGEQAVSVESGVSPKQISFEKVLSIVVALSLLFNVVLVLQIQSLNGQNSAMASMVDKLSSNQAVSNSQTVTTLASDSAVKITVLNDNRCGTNCDVTSLIDRLKQIFVNSQIVTLDYISSKDVYASSNVTYLPAVLFGSDVVKSSGYSQVAQYLVPAGQYLSLRIGGSYDPVCEGDGRCELQRCSSSPSCRTKISNKLDLFVMSHCPYGIQAMNSMKEVLSALKDINFSIHYIAGVDQTGVMSSLHGPTEVADDMRELCAAKYYPGEYMDYIWCRNDNISSNDWQMCAMKAGLNISMIDSCSSGFEGKKLLADDVKISSGLNIGASPTWLANNYKTFSALTAQDIKTNICSVNSGMIGCGTQLSSNTTVAAGSCGTKQR